MLRNSTSLKLQEEHRQESSEIFHKIPKLVRTTPHHLAKPVLHERRRQADARISWRKVAISAVSLQTIA